MNSNQLVDICVSNLALPREGPKCVPLSFDFTAQSSYAVDFMAIQQRGLIDSVQTLFIDNNAGTTALTVLINQSSQLIIAAPGTQGYYPVLCPNPMRFTFTCTGGTANTQVFALNVPIPSSVWSVAGAALQFSGNNLLVSDPAIEAAIVSGQMQSLGFLIGDGGTQYPEWIANASLFGSITATTAALVTGNPGYFVRSLNLSLSPAATQAVAGDWTVEIHDSISGVIEKFALFVPSAAPTLTQVTSIQLQSDPGFVWNNKTANSALSIVLSASLTAGNLYYNIGYGKTAIIG